MPKHRIFIVHPSGLLTDYQGHGDGLLAYRYIRELAARGHRLSVACEQTAFLQPVPPNIAVYPIPLRNGSLLARSLEYAWKMRSLFRRLHREQPFDLAHQLNPVFTGLSLGLLGSKVPLILGPYVTHWTSQRQSPLKASLSNAISGIQQTFADAVIISGKTARTRASATSLKNGIVHTVPYGIDLTMFARQPLPTDDPIILYLGGLDAYKGIFVLLKAFETIATRIPAARLLVVGDGQDAARVREMTKNHPYRDRIILFGGIPQQEVPAQFARASVYCLPSFGEPYGMSLIEAMATGRPVVAVNAGGPADLVDPRGGILVPPNDASSLAQAVATILSSPDMPQAMGDFNRQAVLQYAWPNVIDTLETVYEKVLRKTARIKDETSA